MPTASVWRLICGDGARRALRGDAALCGLDSRRQLERSILKPAAATVTAKAMCCPGVLSALGRATATFAANISRGVYDLVEVEKYGVDELVGENQSTSIHPGAKYRLSSPYEIPVELIQVQIRPYLGREDTTRFQDRHGSSDQLFGVLKTQPIGSSTEQRATSKPTAGIESTVKHIPLLLSLFDLLQITDSMA